MLGDWEVREIGYGCSLAVTKVRKDAMRRRRARCPRPKTVPAGRWVMVAATALSDSPWGRMLDSLTTSETMEGNGMVWVTS
jgi:hypothetical protein